MNITNTTTLRRLAAILSSFSTLLDTLPDDGVSDALFDLYVETMSDQLPTKHYAYYHLDSEPMRYVAIFDTAEERDAYAMKIWGCDPITYDEFIKLADSEEFNLNKYAVKDGKIIFDLMFSDIELPD